MPTTKDEFLLIQFKKIMLSLIEGTYLAYKILLQ